MIRVNETYEFLNTGQRFKVVSLENPGKINETAIIEMDMAGEILTGTFKSEDLDDGIKMKYIQIVPNTMTENLGSTNKPT
ncbi:MAG: hypothetical protein QM500_13195 [Methylococcales bacterium]